MNNMIFSIEIEHLYKEIKCLTKNFHLHAKINPFDLNSKIFDKVNNGN